MTEIETHVDGGDGFLRVDDGRGGSVDERTAVFVSVSQGVAERQLGMHSLLTSLIMRISMINLAIVLLLKKEKFIFYQEPPGPNVETKFDCQPWTISANVSSFPIMRISRNPNIAPAQELALEDR